MIVVTDGNETRSSASLDDAIAAARKAGASIYVVAIESPKFNPAPLHKLAEETGGVYHGTSSSATLQRPVRGDRGRAQAHVDARLRDHGPPRGHRVPRGDVEGREVGSEVDHAAGEPRPRLGRPEAVAPAPRGLLQDRPRHAGDGDRLVLHRAPRRIARDDDGEGRTPEEAARAAPRARARQEAQAGAGAARSRGRALQRDRERLRGLEALEAARPARGAQRPARSARSRSSTSCAASR